MFFEIFKKFLLVFPYIFSCLSYENPKVRLSFLKLIEELSIEFGEDFYKKTHKAQEPKLLLLLDDPILRVKIMSTFTLISYLNKIPKKISKKKLQFLIPKIKQNIQAKNYHFLPEILSLASEFLHHLDTEANEFTKELLPLAVSLKCEGLTPIEEVNFYGKIMEFISIFIQAIQEESLVNPFKDQILNFLLINLGKITNEITLNEIYLLDAWQRIALIYKKDIQNYLAVVIGKMIPLGIKYMKDKEDLQEVNDIFKGNFPRIYQTEMNRDQEIIKNLGEILKIFLDFCEPDSLKIHETVILFLITGYKAIISGLSSIKSQYNDKELEENTVVYHDFNYFYKDLVSCAFLFLNNFYKPSNENFFSNYKRITNCLWEIVAKNPINEVSLIKLQYTVLESLKFSYLDLPSESLSNYDLEMLLAKIKKEWERVILIDFETYDDINEEEENDVEENPESFVDLRMDMYFVIHEILTNLLKKLTEEQKENMIESLFPDFYLKYLDEYYQKEDLTDIEEDILSSILYSVVEILQEMSAEFLNKKVPWTKIIENLIKYTTHPDSLIRHNANYSLGLFHEKVELHHDIYPEIVNYVKKSIENLELAADMPPDSEDESHTGEGDEYMDFCECLDNAYSAIGRMIKVYFGNNEFIKGDLIGKYLKYLPIKYDTEEGKDQHEILLGVLLKHWEEFVQINQDNYGEIIRIMGQLCLESNVESVDLKIKKKIKKLSKIIKNTNSEKFEEERGKLAEETKKALEECMNNKDLDED